MSSSEVIDSENQLYHNSSEESKESLNEIELALVSEGPDDQVNPENNEKPHEDGQEVPSNFYLNLLSRLKTSTLKLGEIPTAQTHAKQSLVYQRSSLSKEEIDSQQRCECCESRIFVRYI